jgi:hypothetical protein
MNRKSITYVAALATTASLGLALSASGANAAEAGSPQPSGPVYACVNSSGSIEWLEASNPGHKCEDGYELWKWAGSLSTKTYDQGAVPSVKTGGSFVTNATQVGSTIKLAAGTYLLSLNAKATPTDTTGTQVFPQFFVYSQAKNTSFAGDLFNVGSGALESGPNHTIDSYYNGSSEITVPAAGETLYVYAFGYDSDTSAGTYELDDLSITATDINVAS